MMKEIIVLIMFALVSLNVYAQTAQNSIDVLLRSRTSEFMTARQSRKIDQVRRFYAPDDINVVQNFIKQQYVSIKADMAKGIFTKAYVKRAIDDSNFADAYKEALSNYIFKDADIDKELDKALTQILTNYKFNITKFEIQKIVPEGNNQKVKVSIVEYRVHPGEKEAKPTQRQLTWKLQNGVWYLDTDKPVNM